MLEQERLLEEARAAMAHDATQPLPNYSSNPRAYDWEQESDQNAAYAASLGLDDLVDTDHGVWWAEGAFPGLRPFHWVSRDPMEQLGLPHGAPLAAVKARYRKLALALHPDKHKEDFPEATAAFIAVTKAYKRVHAQLKKTAGAQARSMPERQPAAAPPSAATSDATTGTGGSTPRSMSPALGAQHVGAGADEATLAGQGPGINSAAEPT